MKSEWISIKEKLPLEEETIKYGIGIADCFLVTVLPKEADPNDDSEVMLLWFNNKLNDFTYTPFSDKPYSEENKDWKVTHWMKLPKSADERKV